MQEFLAMGGYGLYVWGSFGLAAVLMILEPLLLRRRYRQWLGRLRRNRDRSRRRSQSRAQRQIQEQMNNNSEKSEDETQT